MWASRAWDEEAQRGIAKAGLTRWGANETAAQRLQQQRLGPGWGEEETLRWHTVAAGSGGHARCDEKGPAEMHAAPHLSSLAPRSRCIASQSSSPPAVQTGTRLMSVRSACWARQAVRAWGIFSHVSHLGPPRPGLRHCVPQDGPRLPTESPRSKT